MKSQDIILLQWNNNNLNQYHQPTFGINTFNNARGHTINDIFLRSHDFTFIVDNKNYQEVVTHDQRIGGSDQVYTIPYILLKFII